MPRLPQAQFVIGEQVVYAPKAAIGTVVGIRRHPSEPTIQYCFESNGSSAWLLGGDLVSDDEYNEPVKMPKTQMKRKKQQNLEKPFQSFDAVLKVMREAQKVVVEVHAWGRGTSGSSYRMDFPLSKLESAKGLHGYLTTVEKLSPAMLMAIEMEEV